MGFFALAEFYNNFETDLDVCIEIPAFPRRGFDKFIVHA
jgi:hypothetical protein